MLSDSKDDEFPGKSSRDYYDTQRKATAFNQPPRFNVTLEGKIDDLSRWEHPVEKRWRGFLDSARRVLRPDLNIDMSDPKAIKYHQRDLRRFDVMMRQLFVRAADRTENDGYFHRGVSRRGYFGEPIIICWTPIAALPLRVNDDYGVYNGLTLVIIRLADESATSVPSPSFGVPAKRMSEPGSDNN